MSNKLIMACIVLCCSINLVNAQDLHQNNQSFEKIKKALSLSDAQVAEMQKIREESFIENEKLKEKFKAERLKIEKERDSRLKKLLTEKQYYTLKSFKKKKLMKLKYKKDKTASRSGRNNHQHKKHIGN